MAIWGGALEKGDHRHLKRCACGCSDIACKRMPEMEAYLQLPLFGVSLSQFIFLPTLLVPSTYCLGTR